MATKLDSPDRIPGMEWYPALHYNDTPPFAADPDLLVIHSGETYPGVAEFEAKTGCVVHYQDGKPVKVPTCYHVAYSATAGRYVQQVSLACIAWHAGGSMFQGQGKVNARSLSIALPGPYSKRRSPEEHAAVVSVVVEMIRLYPSLRYAVRHSDIDKHKRDPGKGFDMRCLRDVGLELPFRT